MDYGHTSDDVDGGALVRKPCDRAFFLGFHHAMGRSYRHNLASADSDDQSGDAQPVSTYLGGGTNTARNSAMVRRRVGLEQRAAVLDIVKLHAKPW